MAKKDREEEEEGIGALLFGGAKPQIKDLADPKKRKQALRVAKMMGFEVRREQMIRIGIAVAVVMVLLMIGLWAVAKVLGLLFWAVLALVACAFVVRLVRPKVVRVERDRTSTAVETTRPGSLPGGKDPKDLEAWNREAEERADKALAELERKLKDD